MSEMVRSFFSHRNKMASTKPSPWSQMLADVCCTLYFPNDNPWVLMPLIYLTVFFFQMKRYFEAQTTALEVLRAIICLRQTGIPCLVKRCAFFFFFFINEKKWLHQNVLCWRKYNLIFAALYVLQNHGQSVSVATVNPKMLIPFDHKQYVVAEKRQLRSQVFPS